MPYLSSLSSFFSPFDRFFFEQLNSEVIKVGVAAQCHKFWFKKERKKKKNKFDKESKH